MRRRLHQLLRRTSGRDFLAFRVAGARRDCPREQAEESGHEKQGEDEECRRGRPREPNEAELERGRLRRELIERALAQFPPPEPQPSKEQVESVFRSVTASY